MIVKILEEQLSLNLNISVKQSILLGESLEVSFLNVLYPKRYTNYLFTMS